jgi:NAD(P)-dependent dehydrogenase (short-subunit alcohol dehydrogenase family)
MENKSAVHPGSVVLVSGGARGITARCVVELARYAHCKFILLGRSTMEENDPAWASEGLSEAQMKQHIYAQLQSQGLKVTPAAVQKTYRGMAARQEIRQTLEAVEQAGGQAEYISVDVADNRALKQKVAATEGRFGPVTGVIHGAGALADKLIEKKSEQDFTTVVSPKVNGLENLLGCVTPGRLEFLVLFSSIAGVFGNVGQADYALANEVLNKSAYLIQNEHPGCRVVAFDWGPWDGGMVTPELKRAFIEHQVQIIPAESGARMLVNELAAANSGSVQIVVGSRPVLPPPEPGVELQTYHIRRKLLLEDNPFLYDHMIGNHPVLPATCAALWIGTACEQLYPGYTFYSLENFRVLKGIVFDQSHSGEYMLDLQEVAKNGEIVFDATLWSQPKGKQLYHYKVRVTLLRDMPPVPLVDPLNMIYDEVTQPVPGESLYKDGTLFHGPSFQGVERVLSVTEGKLTMQCRLAPVDEARQGQFPVQTLNPYINDTIVQCLLIWAQRIYQAPCLPSFLERYEQYRPIPFGERFYVTMDVQSVSDTSVVGNILVQDALGQAYVRITGLEGTISRQLKRLF